MSADDFAKAMHSRLPQKCPGRTGKEMLEALLRSAATATPKSDAEYLATFEAARDKVSAGESR